MDLRDYRLKYNIKNSGGAENIWENYPVTCTAFSALFESPEFYIVFYYSNVFTADFQVLWEVLQNRLPDLHL